MVSRRQANADRQGNGIFPMGDYHASAAS
jgi:hypothetical protein